MHIIYNSTSQLHRNITAAGEWKSNQWSCWENGQTFDNKMHFWLPLVEAKTKCSNTKRLLFCLSIPLSVSNLSTLSSPVRKVVKLEQSWTERSPLNHVHNYSGVYVGFPARPDNPFSPLARTSFPFSAAQLPPRRPRDTWFSGQATNQPT